MLKRLILAIFLIIGIYESNTMEKILPEMPSDLEIINVDGYRIYTAEIRLESGEIAYFAMEPIINKDRADKLQDYANLTKDLTTQRSYLYSVFMNTNNLMTEISSAFPNTIVFFL